MLFYSRNLKKPKNPRGRANDGTLKNIGYGALLIIFRIESSRNGNVMVGFGLFPERVQSQNHNHHKIF